MSNTEEEKTTTKKKPTVATDESVVPSSFDDYEPSVTSAVLVYWILPIVVLVFSSRFMADPFALAGIGIGELPYNPRVPKKPSPSAFGNNNNNKNNQACL
mmetsp:Transcript_58511/g.119029  ORF Transcript_58511/g.119029 Transcript_58511/m.119029 type:complete len:100 (-) Transcript_58511:2130-2429(-)